MSLREQVVRCVDLEAFPPNPVQDMTLCPRLTFPPGVQLSLKCFLSSYGSRPVTAELTATHLLPPPCHQKANTICLCISSFCFISSATSGPQGLPERLYGACNYKVLQIWPLRVSHLILEGSASVKDPQKHVFALRFLLQLGLNFVF